MQNKHWNYPGFPPPKKFKRAYSEGEVIASIFQDSQGVIIIGYLEQGRTINGAHYAGELRRLRQEIASKSRGKRLAVFCSCRTTSLPTRHKLP